MFEVVELSSIVKAVSAIGGVIAAYAKIKSLRPFSRAALKADLEILSLLNEKDKNYSLVKRKVDNSIAIMYEKQVKAKKDWPTIILGLYLFFTLSYWTWRLISGGAFWKAAFTAYLAFSGVLLIQMGLRGFGFARALLKMKEQNR